jgi:dipeptidyl-peptidase-3
VDQLKDHIYSVSPEPSLFIGKRNLGHVSNYYLGAPIEDDEVAAVQAAAEKIGIDVLNTRSATEDSITMHIFLTLQFCL